MAIGFLKNTKAYSKKTESMNAMLSLFMDLYELTMAECYLHYKRKMFATFDLFVRQLPSKRSYLIACGLEDALEYLKGLRFNSRDVAYLKSQKLFSSDFLAYLSGFKFTGDVWAMDEGTVFFPNEPVLRITAPIIEAQVVESYLLNTVNLQTMIASKASRVVSSAEGKGVYDFSLRRTHGQDAGIKAARSSYIAGFNGTSDVLAGKLYNIPIAGTMAHSFVMSFKNELDSFSAYGKTFPNRAILLVDTYDIKKGIQNAITVGLELKKKGYRLLGIRLDSSDMVGQARLARIMLDKAGLDYVKIFASGNLDEYKIKDMLKQKAPIDNFGVGTHMGASVDAPFLDVIYKISEVTDEKGNFLPTMKLSKGKVTYPGRKQVFRIKDKKGNYSKDILALEDEKINGAPLLKKVVEKGKVMYNQPTLATIRARVKEELSRFPETLKDFSCRYKYPVAVSSRLKRLTHSLTSRLSKRQ